MASIAEEDRAKAEPEVIEPIQDQDLGHDVRLRLGAGRDGRLDVGPRRDRRGSGLKQVRLL